LTDDVPGNIEVFRGVFNLHRSFVTEHSNIFNISGPRRIFGDLDSCRRSLGLGLSFELSTVQVQTLINFMLSPHKQGATTPRRKCNPSANSGVPPSMSPASADIHWFSSTFANVFMLLAIFRAPLRGANSGVHPCPRMSPGPKQGCPPSKNVPRKIY